MRTRIFFKLILAIALVPTWAYCGTVSVDLVGPTSLAVDEIGTFTLTVSDFQFEPGEDRVWFSPLTVNLGDGNPDFSVSTTNKLSSVYVWREADPLNIVRSMTLDFSWATAGVYDLMVTTSGGFWKGVPYGNPASATFSSRFDETNLFQVTIGAPISSVPIPAAASLFGSALGLFGYIGWRKKQQATA